MGNQPIINNFLIAPILTFFKINKNDLLGLSRKAEIVKARHIFAYCLRVKFALSYVAIGKIFKKNHTSIMHACKNVERLMIEDKKIKKFVNTLLRTIKIKKIKK
jgi:chromosomal replication initiator protein